MTQPQAWRGEEDWQRERQDNYAADPSRWRLRWRRNKREARKAWFVRWPELKTHQKSRGFARHIRRVKAAA